MRRATPPASPLPSPARARRASVRIDDPVRLYLLQMGGNPLLTRASEVSSAKAMRALRLGASSEVGAAGLGIRQSGFVLRGRACTARAISASTGAAYHACANR